MNDDFLQRKLEERKSLHSLRQLRLPSDKLVDFCSNDYLGIVKYNLLQDECLYRSGSTGSRLLTGNYPLIEEVETIIADFHGSDASLIFNSGYDANLGILSAIPQRGELVLYDALSHASIRDGIRLSFAESHSFQHNDLDDLEDKLKKSKEGVFIVTESVFSMDGDICPLHELVQLSEKYGARLIIDEAHATGVIGERGEGLVQQAGLERQVFARVHTFGKACGTHGAAVLGSEILRSYLVNFARSLIYSTALPEQVLNHIRKSYEIFPGLKKEREKLRVLVGKFQRENSESGVQVLASSTPIQGIMVPGNEDAQELSTLLKEAGLDVRPILYPTVPRGKERLRIVLHAFNTEMEVDLLLNCLKNSL
jgi:8-amino-7-oxononanoate synthase